MFAVRDAFALLRKITGIYASSYLQWTHDACDTFVVEGSAYANV